MKRSIYVFVSLLVCLLVLIAGCGQDATKTTPTKEQVKIPVEKQVVIYLPTEDAKGVQAKKVPVKTDVITPKLAVETLLTESKKQKYSVFPKDLQVEKVDVHDNIAYVIMNSAFLVPVEGGTLIETLELGSLVNTLTEFPEIRGVTFLVQGKAVLSLSGHIDMSEPLTRMTKLIIP